jgi:hypothetical protein
MSYLFYLLMSSVHAPGSPLPDPVNFPKYPSPSATSSNAVAYVYSYDPSLGTAGNLGVAYGGY